MREVHWMEEKALEYPTVGPRSQRLTGDVSLAPGGPSLGLKVIRPHWIVLTSFLFTQGSGPGCSWQLDVT